MTDTNNSAEVAIIGAGPGGYGAAFMAADLGLKVTLIDPELNPGGVCLYRGCIPSKALLHLSKVIQDADEARNWGVEFSKPKITLDKIRSWKDEVVKKLTSGVGQLAKLRKITYIQGKATFLDAQTLKIQSESSEIKNLTFQNAIIATGSHAATIPGLDLNSNRLMNSKAALELESIPSKLLIIGGGYIGLEMGTVYSTLGSEVTLVEMMPSLLPGVDADLVRVLSKRVGELFETIMLETTVSEFKEQNNGIKVSFQKNGEKIQEAVFEKVLMAVGRKPNSENLGLENTRIETDNHGFIHVDNQRRTKEPSIFAIGDVAGEPMLAHKATHEGRIAAEAITGKHVVFEPQAIPAVVFTDPEIAWCGLTETEAQKEKREIQIAKFPWSASGRATTMGHNDGLTKLIIEPETERLIGAGIVGSGASELISEATLAIEMGANVSDLSLTIHPHPTLSETLMEAAEVYSGQSTHYYRLVRKKS